MEAPEDVVCPVCTASEPEREFRTAPGIKSRDTSFTDSTVKTLAADYGLTDVSNKDGQPVAKRPSVPAHAQAQFTGDQALMGRLARMGGAADMASPLLPMLRQAGRPHQWSKTPERRK